MSRRPALPGRTEEVTAKSVLVVAPHYDDEVLGCGGLVGRLTAGGAVVRVLYLSDGSGGVESVEDRAAYSRRRREESRRVAEILELAGAEHLGLPDGFLAEHLDALAAGLGRAILTQRPDLLLVPSPLELSEDHRAAFAALHRLLATERDESLLAVEVAVLAYEINRPLDPDLLVDVSAELPRLERAMAAYASQEERHPYWRAGLGLREYRTLSLSPGHAAVEAYRRLSVADFRLRSASALVRHLGGSPAIAPIEEGPLVSVVVRTMDRPDLLAEALASIAASRYRRVEVVLVNDGGRAPEVPSDHPFPIRRVELPENRGRAAAANAGVAAATGDYVGFLDDDDRFEVEHLATLVAAVRAAGVRVAYTDAAVVVHRLVAGEGWVEVERRLPYSRDFDRERLLLDNYIPFHTLLVERALFAAAGPFDEELPFFEDWDFLIRLADHADFHHLAEVTCEYRHFRGSGHHALGAEARERADFLGWKARVLAKHAERSSPQLLARVVDRLRGEQVGVEEELAASRREARREREDLEAARRDAERRCADLAERLASLGSAHEAVTAEAQRLYGEEKALRDVVGEQSDHLARTYAEIQRLNDLIHAMQATRAWRFHEWLGRRKPG